MRVRKVDSAGDMLFGGDQAAFLRDTPEAVAQVVVSRLHLWSGEWFLDLNEGTPYTTEVLGKRTEATRDPVLRSRILDTPGVIEITAYDSVLNRQTRGLSVAATIDTLYGRANQGTSRVSVVTDVREGR